MEGWAPLHVHTTFSNFDGTIGVDALFDWAEKEGVPAVAVTDHGMMSAVPKIYKRASKSSVTPIYGCELYMDSVESVSEDDKKDPPRHLLALALSEKGFSNLVKILSIAHKTNFRKKPRTTLDVLSSYSEDIYFSSACIAGELPSLLLRNRESDAVDFYKKMTEATRGNFAVELVDTGDADVRGAAMNRRLYDFAEHVGARTILTCDSHCFPDDLGWYPYIMAARKKNSLEKMNENASEKEAEYDENSNVAYDLSLRTPKTMYERWGNVYPKALSGTAEVVSMVKRGMKIFSDEWHMPKRRDDAHPLPPLPDLAHSGLESRMELLGLGGKREYRERLDFELGVVGSMGFSDYFLMVYEMVKWAKDNGILVGPGRGSAAGSLLAWSLSITGTDPVRNGLYFERFLNPERVSMPDIDVDFEDARRGEVIDHLAQEYGEAAVCGISSHNESKWKSGLRDAARALGFGAGAGELGDVFPRTVGDFIDAEGYDGPSGKAPDAPDRLVDEAVRIRPSLQKDRDGLLKMARLASKFLSQIRHYGRHASGIVIAPPDVTDFCPLLNLKGENEIVVQYDMEGVDACKLVKMDILGLSNLSIMRETLEISSKFDSSTPTPEQLYEFVDAAGKDFSDPDKRHFRHGITRESVERTLDILSNADTTGVFQLASPGMRRLLREIRPKNADAMAALLALFRPGPLASGMTKAYVEANKTGLHQSLFPENVERLLRPVVDETLGMVVYQEQVMRVARVLGGFSLGEADSLRRAMGKKSSEAMAAAKGKFVERCVANKEAGVDEETAGKVFDTLAHFAGYGFNKSHAAAYARLSFATAWYKANRGPAYWCAILESKHDHGKHEDLAPYLLECASSYALDAPLVLPGESFSLSERCRPKRNGSLLGETFGKMSAEEASELAWQVGPIWSVHVGTRFMPKIGGKKKDPVFDMPPCDDFREFFEKMLSEEYSKTNPKTVARMISAGLFDALAAAMTGKPLPESPLKKENGNENVQGEFCFGDALVVHGEKERRSAGAETHEENATSYGENEISDVPMKNRGPQHRKKRRAENDEGELEDAKYEHDKKGQASESEVSVPRGVFPSFDAFSLRACIGRFEQTICADENFARAVEKSLEGIVKISEDGVLPVLLKADRDCFIAWFSLFVLGIRRKRELKKKPWGKTEVDAAVASWFNAFAMLAEISSRMDGRERVERLSVLRTLNSCDRAEFGEGLSVTTETFASELVGYSNFGWVDELGTFADVFTGEIMNDAVGKIAAAALGGGLWFLGRPLKTMNFVGKELPDGTKKPDRNMILVSGRRGENVDAVFLEMPKKMKLPKRIAPGDVWAFRLVLETERWSNGFVKKNWRIAEMKDIPVKAPPLGGEKIEWLEGPSGGVCIRMDELLSKEDEEELFSTFLSFRREDRPGEKGLLVFEAPSRVSGETFGSAAVSPIRTVRFSEIDRSAETETSTRNVEQV